MVERVESSHKVTWTGGEGLGVAQTNFDLNSVSLWGLLKFILCTLGQVLCLTPLTLRNIEMEARVARVRLFKLIL